MRARAIVAALRTSPETVLDDYGRLMRAAGYQAHLPRDKDTALKINITWHHFYPAVNTTPWQIEGVVRTLLQDGYRRELIHGCHNRTVVVSAKRGEVSNCHKTVLDRYGLRNVHLYEGEEWIRYEPKSKMLVLHDIYPKGIEIPKRLVGENIIHLPLAKTHVFTDLTGAMKNAFGGLLHEKRHFTHSVIHETLVDLLAIQKEIHTGLFNVLDATWAGDGPGPRCLVAHEKDLILASADPVAIDATLAKLFGWDPMSLKFVRLAHEQGLGVGDPGEIDVVGDDIAAESWNFVRGRNTLASRGQKMIYWGPLKPLEKLLLRSWIAPWSYAASIAFHDGYWYPFVGRRRVHRALEGKWGRLFQQYRDGSIRPQPDLGRPAERPA
jgi:uncharacterized protein (DUF362 family)